MTAKIVILGEAWGESEDHYKLPFVGASGIELTRMLFEAMPDADPALQDQILAGISSEPESWWMQLRGEWLARSGIVLTNVFNLRPPGNHIEALCCAKVDLPEGYALTPLIKHPKAWYVMPEFIGECRRAIAEIEALRPNLVICLGNTACWLMLQATNIGTIRGAIASARVHSSLGSAAPKCLPTYHPAGVLRNWSWRSIVVADLMKARMESEFAEIRRPQRKVTVNPTLAEVREFTQRTLANPPPLLSVDCETEKGQITCIGFAVSRSAALVIPFIYPSGRPNSPSYWENEADELVAWNCVQALLESEIPKVGQNFLYDLQYILPMGIRPRNLREDTMLLHHAMFPEMQKGLGFLGSIYTNEASWKLMRRGKADTNKHDE